MGRHTMSFTYNAIALWSSRLYESGFNEFSIRAGGEVDIQADIMSTTPGKGLEHLYCASDQIINHLEPLADDLPTSKPDWNDGASPRTQ